MTTEPGLQARFETFSNLIADSGRRRDYSSAGTYSLLQPELSHQLRENKLAALGEGGATLIASANIGCMTHLQSGTGTPIRHWIELVDLATSGRP